MGKITLSVSIAAVVLSLAAIFGVGHQAPAQLAGLENNSRQNFTQGVKLSSNTYGDLLSIASGSIHTTASQLCNNGIISMNADGVGAASASLFNFPSASSLISNCLTKIGDFRFVKVNNLGTHGSVFTLTAPSGNNVDIFVASRSSAAIGKKESALIRLMRETAASVSAEVIELTND